MKLSRYSIRTLPLRVQLRDTYRILFFPGLVCVAVLIYYVAHSLLGAHGSFYPLLGACLGMLPSLWLGTPSRMGAIDASDRIQMDAWLQAHKHVFDPARGWVPKMPRALYFDSQIVRYEGDCAIGPLLMLRKLRVVLQARSRLTV